MHPPNLRFMLFAMSTFAAPDRPSPVWLRLAVFLALYVLFHWAYQALRSSTFDPWFIHTLTVQPAAALIDLLFAADGVTAVGPRLVWPGGRLTLLAGCDGFEVLSLFAAAMLASDMAWHRGLPALLVGCLSAWALNQLRIVWLYWAFRYQRDAFDVIHTAWGPLLLVVAVALVYAWAAGLLPAIGRAPKRAGSAA